MGIKFYLCTMSKFWDLQHNTVPRVNKTVTYAEKCVERADLRLSVPHIHITGYGQEESLGVMAMFITWIVVMVSCVFSYAQTHQIIYIKYMQFLNTYLLLRVSTSATTNK